MPVARQDLQVRVDPVGSASLKVFPAAWLTGLSSRESVAEGDGERVERRPPPGVIWHPRRPAGQDHLRRPNYAHYNRDWQDRPDEGLEAMSAAFDANAGEVIPPHRALQR